MTVCKARGRDLNMSEYSHGRHPTASSTWHFPSRQHDNVAVAFTKGQSKVIANDMVITSNVLYREVFKSSIYTNKSLLMKYLVSTCASFALVRLVPWLAAGLSPFQLHSMHTNHTTTPQHYGPLSHRRHVQEYRAYSLLVS
jgi:hypothetical protein